MSAKHENWIWLSSSAVATDTTGDKATFAIPQECKLVRAYAVAAGTEATALVIKLDYAPKVGSATDRGDGDMGTLTWGTGDKQGKLVYHKHATLAADTTLSPGGAVVAQVTTASTADKEVYVGVIFEYVPETEANQSNMNADSA